MSAIPTLRKHKQGHCHKFEGLCKLQPVVSLPPKLIFLKKDTVYGSVSYRIKFPTHLLTKLLSVTGISFLLKAELTSKDSSQLEIGKYKRQANFTSST